MRLLAGREHSRRELRVKLRRRGYSDEEIDAALESLAAAGLQSDARFAEQYVRSRQQRGYGPRRIRVELKERGVDEALLVGLLDATDPCWDEALRRAHDKKYGPAPPRTPQETARRMRFLSQRGFAGDQVLRLLRDHSQPGH